MRWHSIMVMVLRACSCTRIVYTFGIMGTTNDDRLDEDSSQLRLSRMISDPDIGAL